MSTTTNINDLKINILTKSQYTAATKGTNQIYLVTDESINVATTSRDGLMSASDKTKLDNLEELVGDTSVSAQIETAINNISSNITTYNHPSQFGCTYASTLTALCNALPNDSIFICDASGFTDASWNLPSMYGTILVFNKYKSRTIFRFYGKDQSVGNWQMGFNANNEPTGVWTCDISSVLPNVMYGSRLPDAGTPGRIFFKKVSS